MLCYSPIMNFSKKNSLKKWITTYVEPHVDHEGQLVQHLLSPTANSTCVYGSIRIGSSQIPSSFYHDRYPEVLGPTPVDLSSWLFTSTVVCSHLALNLRKIDFIRDVSLAMPTHYRERPFRLQRTPLAQEIPRWLFHTIHLLTAVLFGVLRGI